MTLSYRDFLRWLARNEVETLLRSSIVDVSMRIERAYEAGRVLGQMEGQRLAIERGGVETGLVDVDSARKRVTH